MVDLIRNDFRPDRTLYQAGSAESDLDDALDDAVIGIEPNPTKRSRKVNLKKLNKETE